MQWIFTDTHTVPTRPHHLVHSPARGDPAPHCSVAGKGVGVVGEPQGAAAVEKGWATDGEASGRGLEDGNLADPQSQAQALWEVAGCRVGSPEEELGGDSSHPDDLKTGHGESGGGGGDDGVHWGGDGGGCCCRCSGGGCCGRGGGASDGLSDHAGVSLEG